MAIGTVRMYNEGKGYGFITPSDGGKDLYVKSTGIRAGSTADMKEGTRVEYALGEGPKGPIADDVRTLATEAAGVTSPAVPVRSAGEPSTATAPAASVPAPASGPSTTPASKI